MVPVKSSLDQNSRCFQPLEIGFLFFRKLYFVRIRCFAKSYSSSYFCCRDQFDRVVIPSSWLACSLLPDGWTELFFLPGGWKVYSLQLTCFLSRLYFLDGFFTMVLICLQVFMKIRFVGQTGFKFLMVGKCISLKPEEVNLFPVNPDFKFVQDWVDVTVVNFSLSSLEQLPRGLWS